MASVPRAKDSETEAGCEEQLSRLRAELEQARGDERQVRALLTAASSFYATDDVDAVFAELARSAVAHLRLADTTVYRTDHDRGLLRGVIRAVAMPDGAVRLEDLSEEIDANSSHPIAEFARGRLGKSQGNGVAVLDADGGGERVLVLMSPAAPLSTGVVAGVVSAGVTPDQRLSERQVELLHTLVSLAVGATEQARIERLRTQLISSVSHELRTPLASIRAYNELLADGDAGPVTEEQKAFLQRIEATTGRLERLVDDLLDLSRLRAGELSVHKSPVDIASVVEHTVNALQPEAMSNDITLTTSLEPDLPPVYTDGDRLCQVLFNLVGNAVKYVGRQGKVQVRVEIVPHGAGHGDAVEDKETDSAELVISVTDNGPGIVPEDLNKIFDEFQRGHGAESITKGAGLGLAIAARLTRLLGGEIGVQSTLGEGSTFYLRFPMRALRLP
ncbi:MAG: HAMP domain-containing histidine kinase [Armatimonadetes bacterium]|nr:HAMP domain-containing histidine kinase [Armatimonadota bacterium]